VRWSPDDRTLAFQHNTGIWSDNLYTVRADGGPVRRLTQSSQLISGLAWMSDGKGLLFSSGRGAPILYLPPMQLWVAPLDGSEPRRITFGDASYADPDIGRGGRLVVSRRIMRFDIWKFPVAGSPQENTARGLRITRQTGMVHTPTLSPDDREMAYLSDSGGRGNLWVMNLQTGATRQVTNETDEFTIGVPVWSPDGSLIVFVLTRRDSSEWPATSYWLVRPDGRDLHNLLPEASWAAWSADSRWIYFAGGVRTAQGLEDLRLSKVPVEGGQPVTVRSELAWGPAPSPDGSQLYFLVPLESVNGINDYEIRVASPESGPSRLLARIPGTQVPLWQGEHPVLSRDGQWLALLLNGRLGTDLWLLSTKDGTLRRVTDFGERRTYIARRVAWSADGRYLYAAVGEADADIVELDGLVP
jgi:TolB protein